MLSFENKLLIKNQWECKGISSRRLKKNFPTRIGKDARLRTFFENCQQLVRSNAQLEVVGRSRFRLQITLLPLRNLFRPQEDKPQTHLSTRQISKELRILRTLVRRIIHNDLRLKCLKSRRAQELVAVWKDLEQHIVDTATDQRHRRLTACIRAKGGHFEHNL